MIPKSTSNLSHSKTLSQVTIDFVRSASKLLLIYLEGEGGGKRGSSFFDLFSDPLGYIRAMFAGFSFIKE